MNLRMNHRHGEAWKQIGVDDSGEPMYRLRWHDSVGIVAITLIGVAVWVYGVAWVVS